MFSFSWRWGSGLWFSEEVVKDGRLNVSGREGREGRG